MSRDFDFSPTAQTSDYYFISYNSEDAERVGLLAKQLYYEDIPLWYDEGLQHSQITWESQLAQKILNAKAMILFVTEKVLQKEMSFVRVEYSIAVTNYQKPVYCVLLDPIDPTKIPPYSVFWYNSIISRQCIDLTQITSLNEKTRLILKALHSDQTLLQPASQPQPESVPVPVPEPAPEPAPVPAPEPAPSKDDSVDLLKQLLQQLSPEEVRSMLNQSKKEVAAPDTPSSPVPDTPSSPVPDTPSAPPADPPRPISRREPPVTILSQVEYEQLFTATPYKNFKTKHGLLQEYIHKRNSKEQVVIPYGVEIIGEGSFKKNSEITEVIVPPSVRYIEIGAFEDCVNLKSIRFYNGLLQIRENAFQGCRSLKQVSLPATLEGIGSFAFFDCTSASVSIHRNVKTIGVAAFNGCLSVTVHPMNSNFRTHSNCLIHKLDNIIISAWQNCSFPPLRSVRRIGDYAFMCCSSLRQLNIPDFIQGVGNFSFSNCYNLEEVTTSSNVESIGKFAFQFCNRLSTVTLRHGINYIDSCAFLKCHSLHKVVLPRSVRYIAKDAFDGCPRVSINRSDE
jgi:hypothetical protein